MDTGGKRRRGRALQEPDTTVEGKISRPGHSYLDHNQNAIYKADLRLANSHTIGAEKIRAVQREIRYRLAIVENLKSHGIPLSEINYFTMS